MPRSFAPPLPFSPHYDFRVIKPITIAGQNYVLGDPFPKDGVSERRLRQMYEARMISPTPPEVLPIVPQAAGKPAQEPEQPPATETPPNGATPLQGALRAEHKGFGRWFVVDEAGTEEGPFTKVEAERRVAAATAIG